MHDDRRLIEDYLPIQAISAEASREKSVRKGHISTLHLWWARRPLVACRAAVYGALVPADQWVQDVELKNPPADTAKAEAKKNGAKKGLNRRQAKEFVSALCKYPGDPRIIAEAQKHILTAHAKRLTEELAEGRKSGKMPAWVEEFKFTGQHDTMEDITAGRAPRPRVLDMFAGGGAIPLEALRLGCEAYAMDLNPVAYIIELCTLVYPQKYGKPDPSARGMTGPKNAKGEVTWGGLAEEVRYWGNWVLQKVKAEIGDLYPPVPDPKAGKVRKTLKSAQMKMAGEGFDKAGQQELAVETPAGYLTPVAYLWTRTVKCKNPACGATVPLVKQTWLCKKKGRYVALKVISKEGGQSSRLSDRPEACPPSSKKVRFQVVESNTEKGLGFDPAAFSSAGNAACPFCGTVADIDYVKSEGRAGRMGTQPMAIVCTRPAARGNVYLAADELPANLLPNDEAVRERIAALSRSTRLTVPDEPIANLPDDCYDNTLGITVRPYGVTTFVHLFTPRQMLCLLTFAAAVREAEAESKRCGYGEDRANGVLTMLGVLADQIADMGSALCHWHSTHATVVRTFGRQALPMVWDFGELAPFGHGWGNAEHLLRLVTEFIENEYMVTGGAAVCRGSATALPWLDGLFDAVITDPPYYDNVPYADISDFFYVWLKRTIGHLYPEHFATAGTPKKQEAVADATRHGGDKQKAVRAYEDMMAQSLAEAHRVLKPGGTLAVVYAHKTTLGWSTLVDAFRRAGFVVTEAWPLDTEMKSRLRGMDSAALASSIFLVGRKREADAGTGSYETDVRPELERVVRERVETLWDMEIMGADLLIACVGAGLRAFTRYSRVEFANGEEVPAKRFLTEVETVVLETILERLSKEVGGNGSQKRNLAGVDPATRFYILWRYTYRAAELDAGEAIIFANGTHVELDGPHGLCAGGRALVEKKKAKYRLRDYTERGDDEKLGMGEGFGTGAFGMGPFGGVAPLIDVLHRMLWLMDNQPGKLTDFLQEARPNLEQVRLVAQALAGPALKGGELGQVSAAAEASALGRLTSNWRSLTEGVGPLLGGRGK
ncbi:MAG: DUF1156 domain-containing protein [Phycisphaerae bacterium]|nr:DUF1156 domain-containing protein [Phycisphaerae bacterium]